MIMIQIYTRVYAKTDVDRLPNSETFEDFHEQHSAVVISKIYNKNNKLMIVFIDKSLF